MDRTADIRVGLSRLELNDEDMSDISKELKDLLNLLSKPEEIKEKENYTPASPDGDLGRPPTPIFELVEHVQYVDWKAFFESLTWSDNEKSLIFPATQNCSQMFISPRC